MSDIDRVQLSKTISRILRHEPWLYELELDDEGWVSAADLLAALRKDRPEWSQLSLTAIEQMIAGSEKQRHELAGSRIRALYGHSVPGKLKRILSAPPAFLFHGTAPEVADAILQEGLMPMGRQYVHLSVDQRVALEVGHRKAAHPCLLRVSALDAHQSGIAFYAGNDKVWLSDFVPARFVERVPRRQRS